MLISDFCGQRAREWHVHTTHLSTAEFHATFTMLLEKFEMQNIHFMQRLTSSFLPQTVINCISAIVHNAKSACSKCHCHYFVPCPRLPSQSQKITDFRPVPIYTAWWYRQSVWTVKCVKLWTTCLRSLRYVKAGWPVVEPTTFYVFTSISCR